MVTIFDMDWPGPQVQHPHFRYFVAQKEKAPDTGRLHWQGYVEVKEKCRIKKMKEVLGCPSAHLEPRRGSQEEAIAYCTKVESRAEPYEKMEHGTKAVCGRAGFFREHLLVFIGTLVVDAIKGLVETFLLLRLSPTDPCGRGNPFVS